MTSNTPQPRDLKQRYVLYEKLGEGGMAEVYRAKHLQLDRQVALKYIKLDDTSDTAARRLRDEARAIARLNHPNILHVYDFEAEEGANRFFMAMEYLPEGDLLMQFNKRQLDENPFSLPDIVTIVKSVASGLGYAHQRGIIHRDVKLSNIFVTQDKRVVIGDFGLAKVVDAPTDSEAGSEVDLKLEQTLQGVFIGTPTYLSPEQIQGITVDQRTDIYALGIVFFQLVIGHPPYSSNSLNGLIMQHLQAPIPDVAALRPDLPPLIPVIIQRCLAKQPDDRYATMQELMVDLTALQAEWSDSAGTFTRVSQPVPTTTIPRRRKLQWAAVIALLLLVVGVGGFMVLTHENEQIDDPIWITLPSPAYPGEYLIVVGAMSNDATGVDAATLIQEHLQTALLSLALQGNLRVETWTFEITSEAEAQDIGERTNATLVIWGQATKTDREIVVSRTNPEEGSIAKLAVRVPLDENYNEQLLNQVIPVIHNFAVFLTIPDLIAVDNMYSTIYLLFTLTIIEDDNQALAATPFEQRLMKAFGEITATNYAEADLTITDLLLTVPDDLSLNVLLWVANALDGQADLAESDGLKIQALTENSEFSKGLLMLSYYLYNQEEEALALAATFGEPDNSAVILGLTEAYLFRLYRGEFASTEADILATRQALTQFDMPNPEQRFIELLVFIQKIKGDEPTLQSLAPIFLETRRNRFILDATRFFQKIKTEFVAPIAFSQGGNNEEMNDQLTRAGISYAIGLELHPTDYLLNWRQASLDVINEDYQAAYDHLEIALENAPVPFPIARFEQAVLVNQHSPELEGAATVCYLLREARTLAETDPEFYAVLLGRITELNEQACPSEFG